MAQFGAVARLAYLAPPWSPAIGRSLATNRDLSDSKLPGERYAAAPGISAPPRHSTGAEANATFLMLRRLNISYDQLWQRRTPSRDRSICSFSRFCRGGHASTATPLCPPSRSCPEPYFA